MFRRRSFCRTVVEAVASCRANLAIRFKSQNGTYRNQLLAVKRDVEIKSYRRNKINKMGGSLSGAIPDGKIPRGVFVCVLTGSLCNTCRVYFVI